MTMRSFPLPSLLALLSCLAAEARAADAGSPDTAATFTRDVAPILNANCVSCYRPGEVAPFPLMTYADAKKRARQIADLTHDRVMPP